MKKDTKEIFRFYWRHVTKQKLGMTLMVLGITVSVMVDMYRPILFKSFIDIVGSGLEVSTAKPQLIHILLLMIGISIVEWIGYRIAEFSSNIAFSKIMKSTVQECFSYVQGHSVDFFNNTFVGSLIKKINRAPRAFDTLANKIIWNLWPMFVRISIVLGVLTYLNPWLGLIMFVWTVVFMFLNVFLANYKLKFDVLKAKAETKASGALADSISNHSNVKLFSSFGFEFKKFSQTLERLRLAQVKSWDLEAQINAVQSVLMISLEIGILYIAIQMWGNGQLSIGGFVLIQAYILEVFHQLWGFAGHMRSIYEKLADADEIVQILNTEHSVKDYPEAVELKVKKGLIKFEQVDFSYGEGQDLVIEDLNLKIKAGEKVAFIGPSGGGKSTILKLILRLFDLSGGKILIDNQDISKVTQDSLRSHIALVPQDPILFHRSLAENIAYGHKEASLEEITAAAKLAKCHDFIMDMPKQYDTLVGERGVKLSGGQRQRVAIARAILANASVLVLDEATSSLDSESETLIQEALDNLMKNKTTIIVAHRLSTIMKADRILVLKKGKIVEEGSHGDLLNENNSLYKKLWDLQVGGYLE
jgi:ATP-binding cassette subfamily B protein